MATAGRSTECGGYNAAVRSHAHVPAAFGGQKGGLFNTSILDIGDKDGDDDDQYQVRGR